MKNSALMTVFNTINDDTL